jgi:hypothetical protein
MSMLRDDDELDAMLSSYEDRSSLAKCPLVAWRWRAPAQRLLFRRLLIMPWLQPTDSWAHANERYLSAVRVLVFGHTTKERTAEEWAKLLGRFVRFCPNVQEVVYTLAEHELDVVQPRLKSLQAALHALSRLTLSQICLGTSRE